MRWRFSTRTIGAAYLVVGAGSGVGAAFGGGGVAIAWGVTCGAMGVAWLAPTDVVVRPDRIRLPRRGFRHRDVLLTDIARITTPHAWAVDPLPRADLRDGTRVPLRGLADDDLVALATAAGVPIVAEPRPAATPAP